MRPDAATPTAPEVVDHGVLAAVLKQGAFDPADGALALRHREEEQHGTYRIANSPRIASVPSENAAHTSTSASSSQMVQTTSPLTLVTRQHTSQRQRDRAYMCEVGVSVRF